MRGTGPLSTTCFGYKPDLYRCKHTSAIAAASRLTKTAPGVISEGRVL